MSDFMIHKEIERLGLQNSCKILYNFDSFSGGYINSITESNLDYSGEIINYTTSFTGQASGSGFFDGQYINISNTSSIDSRSSTLIFSFEKTGVSNGTLFSHIAPGNLSGWEIGINEANKIYFKNYVNQTVYYETLDCYLADKNLFAFSVSEQGSIFMGKIDFSNKQHVSRAPNEEENNAKYYNFEYESFRIPGHSIENGQNWKIGSGEYLYNGYVDYFLYFDRNISRDNIRRICHGIYSEGQFVPDEYGELPGIVTGYEKSGSGISGKIGVEHAPTSTGTESGFYTYQSATPLTGVVDISGEIFYPYKSINKISGTDQLAQNIHKRIRNLSKEFDITGGVNYKPLQNFHSSGPYWDFSGASGSFNDQIGSGSSGQLFGITGFDIVELTGYVTGRKTEFFQSRDVSGVIYNKYTFTPLTGAPRTYLKKRNHISGEYDYRNYEYYPNAITLQYPSDQNNDFINLVFDIDEGVEIDRIATSRFESTYENYVGAASDFLANKQAIVYLNGVAQYNSDITFYKNANNQAKYTVDTGVFISGGDIFTNIELDIQDSLLYDIVDVNNENTINITSIEDYSEAPFVNFNFKEKDIFLNGIKIYSGVDWIDNNGFFPIGQASETEGLYFSVPKYSGCVDYTGFAVKEKIIHNSIVPDHYIFYRNGIRENSASIIMHSINADLISGCFYHNIDNIVYTSINEGLET